MVLEATPDVMADQGFTPAETTVVLLLLEGLSNREIASRLVVSIRTVESHISNTLEKSGCRSRLELSMWWLRTHSESPRTRSVKLPSSPA
jgi:DNA-binding NarL/FixJ family response regulator